MLSAVSPRYAIVVALCAATVAGCQEAGRQKMQIIKAGHTPGQSTAAAAHAEGVKLLRQGKLAKAEAAFQQAITQDENFGPAYNNLGLLHFQRRQFYAAANNFQRAADLMPDRPEPYNNLGLTLETAAKPQEAIALYQSAVERAPDNPEYLGNLLRARLHNGEPVPALREGFQKLLLLETRPEWVHWAEENVALFDPLLASSAKPTTSTAPESPEVIPTPIPGDDLPLRQPPRPTQPPLAPLPLPWGPALDPPLPK